MKRSLLIISLFLVTLGSGSNVFGKRITGFSSMPMPTQYSDLVQYQQALQAWENAYKSVVACSTQVRLPLMPMPTQYRDLELYQNALNVWERVASAQRSSQFQVAEGDIIKPAPMPMPTQYQQSAHYQDALTAWVKVHKKIVAQSSHVQPLSMPMPSQYQKFEEYQSALQAWVEVFE